jgi:hypothetical protein
MLNTPRSLRSSTVTGSTGSAGSSEASACRTDSADGHDESLRIESMVGGVTDDWARL